MKQMSSFLIFLLAFITFGCAGTPEPTVPHSYKSASPYRDIRTLEEGTILHVQTGTELSEDQLIDYLGPSRIVYIGEVHTNIHHHRIQLDILKALVEKSPGKIAVGMEMFKYTAQPMLDQWSLGKLDEKGFARLFYANWNQDYDYYKEIFHFIRDHKIPLIALNASDTQIRLLSGKGLKGLTEEERKDIPELDLTDPYHRRSMEAIFGGHAHGKRGFDPFYETMLLWDETMAKNIAGYLSGPEGKDKTMVVMTGGFHVTYGYGIPRRVFRRFPEPYTIVLPKTLRIPEGKEYVEMKNVTPPQLPLPIADVVWIVPYEDLEDSRIRLGVEIAPSEKGVLIQKVEEDSSAEQAGLMAGDIITDFDKNPVLEPFDLVYEIGRKQTGAQVSVKVLRGEEMIELNVEF